MSKRFHVEQDISAPAERVWQLLTDGPNYPSWNPAVLELDGTIAVGQRISLVSIVNPKRTFKLNVVEVSAPTSASPSGRMVWSDGMPLGLFTGARTYLVDERDGVTTFSMTEEYTGLLAGLITKSIPDMSDSFVQFAAGLKAAAEA
ncbi:MAG: SRPBCC family protein [Acidimicrobiales bacterium]